MDVDFETQLCNRAPLGKGQKENAEKCLSYQSKISILLLFL